MTAQDKKKVAAVIALFGFLAVYWGYQLFLKNEGPQTGPVARTAAPVRRAEKGKPPSPLDTPIKVDLGLLKRRGEPYKAGRNIFNPVYKKPALVKPPAKGVITVTPALPPPPPPPPPRPPEEIAADNAKEELNKIKVLGFLKRKSRTDVFLALGNNSYIAGTGDSITKGYYLKEVGKDYIVVGDRDTKVEVKLNTSLEGEKGKTNVVPSPGMGGGGTPSAGAPPGVPPVMPMPPPGGGGPGPAGPRHYSPQGTQPGSDSGVTVNPNASQPPYTPGTNVSPQNN